MVSPRTNAFKRKWLKAAGRVNGLAARYACQQDQYPDVDLTWYLLKLNALAERFNNGERSDELLRSMMSTTLANDPPLEAP